MQHADDIVGAVAPQRQPRHRRRQHGVGDVLRRIVGVQHHHFGAVDHDVGDRELAQIENAAHHVAVELLDDAGVMQQIDGAAQLLARRQDRLDGADLHAEAAQDDPHQPFDAVKQRREQLHGALDRLRHHQRDTVRRVERRGLRQHFGHHENQDRHHEVA